MREEVENILQVWKIPKRYVGYGHLLVAAELYEQGEPVSPILLYKVAEIRGRRIYQVRMACYTVLKHFETTAFGREWEQVHGHKINLWEFLIELFALAEERKEAREKD